MIDWSNGHHLLYIPVDGEIEFHNIGNLPLENAGMIATSILDIPVALMTEHETPYDVLPTVIVYHQGQDGRFPLNWKAAGGLQAVGVDKEYEGDIVILFMQGLTA